METFEYPQFQLFELISVFSFDLVDLGFFCCRNEFIQQNLRVIKSYQTSDWMAVCLTSRNWAEFLRHHWINTFMICVFCKANIITYCCKMYCWIKTHLFLVFMAQFDFRILFLSVERWCYHIFVQMKWILLANNSLQYCSLAMMN